MIRIKAIQCRHIANLEDVKVEFANGVNLVLGDNEAGKSTLIKAMAGILFGVEDQSLKPLGFSGDYGAALRLSSSDDEYIFDRNFENNRIQLFKIEDGEPKKQFDAKASPRGRSADVLVYFELLKKIIGVSEKDIFEASALLMQQDLSLGKANTAKKIKQILSGQSTHDSMGVIDNLNSRYFEITVVNPNGSNMRKPRLLEIAQSKKDELLQRKYEAEKSFQTVKELQSQIRSHLKQAEDWKKNIANLGRLITVATEYFNFEQENQEQTGKHREFTKERTTIFDLKTGLERVDRQIADLGIAGNIDDTTEEKIRGHISLKRQIEIQQIKEKEAQKAYTATRSKPNIGFFLSVVGTILTLAAGVAATLLSELWVGLVLLVLPISIGINAYLSWKRRKENLTRLGHVLEKEKDETQRLALEIEAIKIPSNILSLGPEAFSQLLVDKEKAKGFIREKDLFLAQQKVLPPLSDVDTALANISRKIAVLEERMDTLKKTHPELKTFDHDELMKKMTQLNDLEDRLEKLEADLSNKKEGLAAASAVSENPESIIEQIEDLDEQIEGLCEKRDAAAMALEAVQWAIKEFRGEYLVNFAKEVGDIFSALIDDDARQVAFDNDLVPALTSQGGELPIENLSFGTRDQLYLAARIALADRLAEKKSLPLILDDPFVCFDPKRKAHTMNLLGKIADKHQVLIFSHDRSLTEKADEKAKVILLD